MSVKLVLLGMLKTGPQYGYELKSRIEQEMGDWTSIAFGSIYFALKKLTGERFIEQTGTEQQGSRPSRIIYRITAEGEAEFHRLLEKAWNDDNRVYFPFDIGLYFMREMEKEKRIKIIDDKIQRAEKSISYLKAHRDTSMQNPHIPAEATAIFSHSFYHLEAELAWLREVKTEMQSGEY